MVQLLLSKLIRAPPPALLRKRLQVADPLEGRSKHIPVVIPLVMGHDREVWMRVEEVG